MRCGRNACTNNQMIAAINAMNRSVPRNIQKNIIHGIPPHIIIFCPPFSSKIFLNQNNAQDVRALLQSSPHPDIRALMILLLRMMIVRQRHRSSHTYDRAYVSVSSSGTGMMKGSSTPHDDERSSTRSLFGRSLVGSNGSAHPL